LRCRAVGSGPAAVRAITAGLSDHRELGRLATSALDGLSVLKALKENPEFRRIPVVIITAFGGSEQTIEGMKVGVYDYITKPFDPDELLRTATRAIEVSRLSTEVEQLIARIDAGDHDGSEALIGQHPAMRDIFKLIGKVAPTEASVLIVGESGIGKELIAQAIHRHSRRVSGPLVAVNSAAIPSNLIESELFGYERGAFTGANASRAGRIEQADGGTLFLDEIGDLPLEAQANFFAHASGTQIRTARGRPDHRFQLQAIGSHQSESG
jgi:two-component system, NtrC family, response regulator AtoC